MWLIKNVKTVLQQVIIFNWDFSASFKTGHRILHGRITFRALDQVRHSARHVSRTAQDTTGSVSFLVPSIPPSRTLSIKKVLIITRSSLRLILMFSFLTTTIRKRKKEVPAVSQHVQGRIESTIGRFSAQIRCQSRKYHHTSHPRRYEPFVFIFLSKIFLYISVDLTCTTCI